MCFLCVFVLCVFFLCVRERRREIECDYAVCIVVTDVLLFVCVIAYVLTHACLFDVYLYLPHIRTRYSFHPCVFIASLSIKMISISTNEHLCMYIYRSPIHMQVYCILLPAGKIFIHYRPVIVYFHLCRDV